MAFNLRFITFAPVTSPKIPHARGGGKRTAYRVGPKYRRSRWNTTPVPGLHEYGGMTKGPQNKNKPIRQFRDRDVAVFKRSTGTLRYPPRPYMRPSAKEARTSSQRRSPNSYKKLVNLGGLEGKRIY